MTDKIPLTIRLPESLHQNISSLADEDNVSINVFINKALDLYMRYRYAIQEFRAGWILQEAQRSFVSDVVSAKSEEDFYGMNMPGGKNE